MTERNVLDTEVRTALLDTLAVRFEENKHRHANLAWEEVQARLENKTDKLWSLYQMEQTGGEPDVAGYDATGDVFVFYDFAAESPKGRRSVCYDRAALEARKKYKPENNVLDMAAEMGVELLTEEGYRALQALESVDKKTSSWIKTPDDVRELGGALFCDYRYGKVFVYHNGADSYYAARGFRAKLTV